MRDPTAPLHKQEASKDDNIISFLAQRPPGADQGPEGVVWLQGCVLGLATLTSSADSVDGQELSPTRQSFQPKPGPEVSSKDRGSFKKTEEEALESGWKWRLGSLEVRRPVGLEGLRVVTSRAPRPQPSPPCDV